MRKRAYAILGWVRPVPAPTGPCALVLGLAFTAMMSACTVGADRGAESGALQVHFLDVGQGDAALIRTPGGEVVLVDAGPVDRGEDVVAYLRERGVTEVRAIAPSHAHADHMGGFLAVLDAFPVREVWLTGQTANTVTWKRFEARLATLQVPQVRLKDGDDWEIGGARIEVLNPPDPPHRRDVQYDNSHVLRITYGSVSFLFTGDIHERGEMALLSRARNVQAHVLKVSEHGGGTGSTDEFLEAVQARVALIGVGKGNPFHHPTQRVLGNLDEVDATVLSTDEHGTIVLITDGASLTIRRSKPIGAPLVTIPIAQPAPALRYDPFGPDRNCGDFATWREAQTFYEAAGGPTTDRHRLDPDRDGIACESLPGAPR